MTVTESEDVATAVMADVPKDQATPNYSCRPPREALAVIECPKSHKYSDGLLQQ